MQIKLKSNYLRSFDLPKLGFNTKYLPATKFYNVGGVTTKCYKVKDIVFGLSPKDEATIIIYK